MYVKVPGVWTAAHEENNQFRSVNINHGPGPCEWAGVAAVHVPRLRRLVLASHNIDIYKEEGRWMPPLEYMIKHEVPVITGMQREGDAVTVGIGCVHWVYSRGRTCCTAWNIGELSFDMFDAAFRRWDDNIEIGKYNSRRFDVLLLLFVVCCLLLLSPLSLSLSTNAARPSKHVLHFFVIITYASW